MLQQHNAVRALFLQSKPDSVYTCSIYFKHVDVDMQTQIFVLPLCCAMTFLQCTSDSANQGSMLLHMCLFEPAGQCLELDYMAAG